jgi:hypothetical protein
VDAQLEDRRGHTIQFGHFKAIEVGKPQLTAQALCRKGIGVGVSHTPADDADAKPTLAVEFSRGDSIPVAVKSH